MREETPIKTPSDASPIQLVRFPRPNERLPLLGLSVFLIFLFLRPADLFPVLTPVRPVLVVLLLTTAIFFLNRSRGQRIFLMSYSTGKYLVLFLGVMLLSIPFSYWPGGSFTNASEFMKEVVVFILLVNIAASLSGLTQLTRTIILCNVVLALLAVKDYLTGNLLHQGRIEGLGGLFNDPNDLAVLFITVVPFIYWRLQSRPGPKERFLLIGAMILVVGGVFATQSRGGFLGLMAVAGLILMRSRRKAAVFFFAAAIAIVIVLVSPQGVFERFSTITSYQGEENAQIRLAMWRAGLRMFADHPILGVGTGVFSIAYGEDYRDPDFSYNTWWTAHNTVVQVMAELGLAGLLVWLGLVISGFSILTKTRRRLLSADRHPVINEALELNSALSVSLIGFLVSSLFLSKAYDWTLIILLAMITASFRMTEIRSPESSVAVRPRFAGRPLQTAGPNVLRKGHKSLKEKSP